MCNQVESVELGIGINLLRSDVKVFKLPTLDTLGRFLEDGERVQLLLLEANQYSVESTDGPIKMGKLFGNRVFLNSVVDEYNINPFFVWNAKQRLWVLCNAGYVCFAEIEVEYKKCHKVWGRDA